jgi:hypothetical protein
MLLMTLRPPNLCSTTLQLCLLQVRPLTCRFHPASHPDTDVGMLAFVFTDLPKAGCLVSEDCATSTSLMFCNTSNTTVTERCSCFGGQRTCNMMGQCQLSMCGACQAALKVASVFATSNLSADPQQLRLQWLSFCGEQWPAAVEGCMTVGAQLVLRPATAHRPGLLSRLLGVCSPESAADCASLQVNISTATPDSCTADGRPDGPQLPDRLSVAEAAATANSRCVSSSDCTEFGAYCRTNSSQQLCVCEDGVDSCFNPGTCTSDPCTECSACLSFASRFAALQVNTTDAGQLATAFLAACKTANISDAKCQTTAASIGGNLALGKRAGGMCRDLQLCPTTMPSNCTLLVRSAAGTLFTAPATQLDLCTVEGVPSGSQLPGVVLPGTLPAGGCWNDTSCGSPDLRCDQTGSQQVRSCSGGVDSTTPAGKCVNTTCAICKGCLQTMLDTFVLPKQYVNGTELATAFRSACQALYGATPAACDQVAQGFTSNSATPEAVTTAATLARRAGALCAALGAAGGCSADVDASCRASLALPTGRLNGTLDKCTVEGVAGGNLPGGLSANGEQSCGCDQGP